MNKIIAYRLLNLRAFMRREGISAFIVPSTDPHSGEYVPERWKSRRWLTGFTGSAGTAVVTLDKAAIWTDSRYFIQAKEQLEETEFILQKEKIEGTPSITEWLGSELSSGEVVGVDGEVMTVVEFDSLKEDLNFYGLTIKSVTDPFNEIWLNRPSIPDSKVFIHDIKYAGETAKSKLQRIRERLNGNTLLVCSLEEIAWTLNLRADDILYTPFFVSYLIISQDDATLFINNNKLTTEVKEYLKENGVSTKPYDNVFAELGRYDCPIFFQPEKTNHNARKSIRKPVARKSPIGEMLIFKNETEIRGYRNAMEKDGVAMVKWIKWTLDNVPKGGQTELSLAAKLEAFRAEQPDFKGISFESIMGYAHHGAIVHYDPTPETDIPVKPEGLLLIDSGAQFLDGTTDITRTIPLGPLTWEMKRDYTLVLRGWINLGSAVFPKGTNGTQLDALARAPMWKYGINYLHGTGHGVGQFMSVHEAIDLHQFRMQWRPTPLLPGMIITDEPGIYIEGSHGVRHEDTMLVVNADFSGKSGKCKERGALTDDVAEGKGITFGPYYTFEHLTLCPILTSPILTDMLTDDEKAWFNSYQQTVYDRLSSRLDDEHRQWLYDVTRPI